jgi:hypothetical protein
MTNILLTGAGFSRNWGGMLAKDVFFHLLGDDQLDQQTRDLLIRAHTTGGTFEDVLAALQLATHVESKKRYEALIASLVGLFNQMGQAFMQREFEFKNPPDTMYWLTGFLRRFPYIFTLNQDTLLELHYLPFAGPGAHIPGMKYVDPPHIAGTPYGRAFGPMEPNPSDFQLSGSGQHYIKLHGSFNWAESSYGSRILIMGGQKIVNIKRFPILTFYHDQFRSLVTRPGARLMVIGYSFSDEHINEAILDAVLKHGLALFIVDPSGMGVLDKRDPRASITPPPGPLMDLIPKLKGVSDRPLSSTFRDDRFEWSKLSRFLE